MEIECIRDKGSSSVYEDNTLIGEKICGVFDGSTSLNSTTYADEKTGGCLAASIAMETFRDNDKSLISAAKEANDRIEEAMIDNQIDISQKINRWSTSAAVAKWGNDSFEWMQTGDCVILAIYRDDTYKVIVDGWGHDRETLIQWKKVSGDTNGTIQEVLQDRIERVRNNTNITYGALNGEPGAVAFLQSGNESLKGIRHLLLFTDGFLAPQKRPEEETNYALMTQLYLEKGLAGIRDHVRNLEHADPRCIQYPRFKQHDDIAAVSLSFDQPKINALK